MAETVRKGQWVEIYRVVLSPGERAPQVPDDTKKVPLEMRVKGFLEKDAVIGDEVTVTTAAGRSVSGTLAAVNPAYTHGFGEPIPELIGIGREVRGIIAEQKERERGEYHGTYGIRRDDGAKAGDHEGLGGHRLRPVHHRSALV